MIMVDDSNPINDGKFGYVNQDGEIEYVEIGTHSCVHIVDNFGCAIPIYNQDIPKLILAMQAAQEYIEKNKEF